MNEYVKVLALRREFPQIGIGKVKTALTEAKGDMEVARFYLTTYAEGLTFKLLAIHTTPDQEGRKLENLRKSLARDMADFLKDMDTHTEQQVNLPEAEDVASKSKEERNVALMKLLRTPAKMLASKVQYEMKKPRTVASALEAQLYRFTVWANEESELNKLLTEAVQAYRYENGNTVSESDNDVSYGNYMVKEYFSEVIESLGSLGITCEIFGDADGKSFSTYLSVAEKDVEKFKYLVLQGAKSNE